MKHWNSFVAWLNRFWPQCIFGLASILHLLKIIQVDVYFMLLLLLAFMPKLLPLVKGHVQSINIGDLFELIFYSPVDATKEAEKRPPEPSLGTPASTDSPPPATVIPARSSPPSEIPEEKFRILSTLWHYQKELYGADSAMRWGIAPSSSNTLLRLVLSILAAPGGGGLVAKTDEGLYYLTDKGIAECKARDVELSASGPYYKNFAPLSEAKKN